MKLRQGVLLAVALLAAFVIGCGDDESSSTSSDSSDSSVASVSDATVATVSDETASTDTTSTDDGIGEIDAIETTIKSWLTEGGCDLMTDKFLEDQTFIDNRDEACDTFEKLFTEPQYSADDIVVGDVEYADDKATAEVGDTVTDITSTYNLVYEDGTWRIDSVDL